MAPGSDSVCRWIGQADALANFAGYAGKTESQAHIRGLHWYAACRLVLEGGFLPEDVTPRPPFRATRRTSGWHLDYDPSVADGGERTVLGGLKTKNVDVVAVKDGLGPVLAISCKGSIGAFRNLTNRMEEAVGECTNLHITYPAMVTGYLSPCVPIAKTLSLPRRRRPWGARREPSARTTSRSARAVNRSRPL